MNITLYTNNRIVFCYIYIESTQMEFPDLGSQCSYASCQQLDFLPFKCNKCNKIFCLEHMKYDNHQCPVKKETVIEEIKKTPPYNKCIVCKTKLPVSIKCSKCSCTVCLKHRFPDDHKCLSTLVF